MPLRGTLLLKINAIDSTPPLFAANLRYCGRARMRCSYTTTRNGQFLFFSFRFRMLARGVSNLPEYTRSGSRIHRAKTRRCNGLFRWTSYSQPNAPHQKRAMGYADHSDSLVYLFWMDDRMGDRAI